MLKQIYINGNIITVDCENERAEAFVVENGKFSFVGATAGALRYDGEDAVVTDLKGATVVPGFNDSHCHLLNYAYGKTKIDLTAMTSPEEVVKAARQYIRQNSIPAGKWVVGRGWSEYSYPNRALLDRHWLDKISTEHPILFTRVCEHTVAVNTKALELIGITDDTPDPTHGKIQRDKDGHATGILNENARYLAYGVQPDVSVAEIKEMLVGVMQELASYGLTSVQTDDFETFSSKNYENVIQAYRELEQEGRLSMRIYEQCLLPQSERFAAFMAKGYKTGAGSEKFKIGPLKLLVDGSLGPKTAFLAEDYADDPGNCGLCAFTQEQLDALVLQAQRNKMQVLCHGIGDAAMERILDSYERAIKECKNPDPRLGIVHVQVTTPNILRRMKQLDIIAYAEPVCVGADLHCADSRLGPQRIRNAYNYRTMFDMGIKTTLSSDCPIDSVNPLDSAYIAITRKDLSGYPEGGWYPEQALNIQQVLRGFTQNSAYASFEEDIKGSITPGKLADFVVLSQDIMTVLPDELRSIKVLKTFVDGKQTYPL